MVDRGVPQGSVLGLCMPIPEGCEVCCFADDTLVPVGRQDIREARECAGLVVALIERKLRSLGLKIAPHKSEVMLFKTGSDRYDSELSVNIGGTDSRAAKYIKYLGLIIDR